VSTPKKHGTSEPPNAIPDKPAVKIILTVAWSSSKPT